MGAWFKNIHLFIIEINSYIISMWGHDSHLKCSPLLIKLAHSINYSLAGFVLNVTNGGIIFTVSRCGYLSVLCDDWARVMRLGLIAMCTVITFNKLSAIMRNFASCLLNISLQGDQYNAWCVCKKWTLCCFNSEGQRQPKANYGLELWFQHFIKMKK